MTPAPTVSPIPANVLMNTHFTGAIPKEAGAKVFRVVLDATPQHTAAENANRTIDVAIQKTQRRRATSMDNGTRLKIASTDAKKRQDIAIAVCPVALNVPTTRIYHIAAPPGFGLKM